MSEQTSQLHDQTSIEARQPVRVTLPSLPRIEAGTLTSARTLSIALFVLILLAGGFIRLTHGNWDRAIGENTTSGHLHPDERFLTQISVDTKAPGSIGEYFYVSGVFAAALIDPCEGDANNDGEVNFADVTSVLQHFLEVCQ